MLKSRSEGKAREARTYRALQVEEAGGSGEGSPGDEAMVPLAPLCQDAVGVHGHARPCQGLPHCALQGSLGQAGAGRAQRSPHEVDAGAINPKG